MNIFKFILIVFICISCKTQEVKKELKIISAQKEHWLGGVRGVEGDNFLVKLQSKTDKKIKFLSLNYKGNTLPVKVTKKDNIFEVKASYSENRSQPQISLNSDGSTTETKSSVESKTSFLEYEVNNKKDTLQIHQFVESSMGGPLIP